MNGDLCGNGTAQTVELDMGDSLTTIKDRIVGVFPCLTNKINIINSRDYGYTKYTKVNFTVSFDGFFTDFTNPWTLANGNLTGGSGTYVTNTPTTTQSNEPSCRWFQIVPHEFLRTADRLPQVQCTVSGMETLSPNVTSTYYVYTATTDTITGITGTCGGGNTITFTGTNLPDSKAKYDKVYACGL